MPQKKSVLQRSGKHLTESGRCVAPHPPLCEQRRERAVLDGSPLSSRPRASVTLHLALQNTSPRSADGVASDASGSALSALPQEQPHKAKLSYAAAAAAGSAAAAVPASAPAKPAAAPAAARKPQAQQAASGPAASPGAASAASQRSAAAPKNGAGAVASAPAKAAPAPAALGAGAAPVSSSSKKAAKAAAAAAPAPKKKAAAAAALAPPPRGITGAGPASLGGFTSTSDAATDAAIAAALSGDEQGVDDGWEVVSAKKPRAKAAAAVEGGELSE